MSAVISPCGRYRYWLERQFDIISDLPMVMVMLNPSTADETKDDPTIRRCLGFAKAAGCGRLIVVNLFALRATDPRQLWRDGVKDPIGEENDDYIRRACQSAFSCHGEPGAIVAAWGGHGNYMQRGEAVRGIIESEGRNPLVLRLTKGGQPAHPLYLPGRLTPIRWPNP